ncbi:hypothetical protein [Frondihabitans peucedani]|uniref:Major facilitator superfamily (MFS) profile domain-containing protein n=1 Tax=Frondihabitans peucedani TaxID=598626 RepID=A0ABP8E328_9MICO
MTTTPPSDPNYGTPRGRDYTAPTDAGPAPAFEPLGAAVAAQGAGSISRDAAIAREKEEYGGMKFGVAFFGWLTATGLTVLLGGILTAIGYGINATTNGDAANTASNNQTTTGIGAVIVFLVVVLIAYFAGGYVAGRMTRFSGLKQGLAVWLWALVITIVLGVIGAIAGSQYNILDRIGTLPSMSGQMTLGTTLSVLAVAVIALIGALLGGLAGMRYHRKVDRAGYGA